MSASTVARWNAIPLNRPESSLPENKRTRSNDDESDDDDISLVSRSPSPQPDRDAGMEGVNLYDEYVKGSAREVITVETRIKNTNKGFAMLAKLGWKEGQPLGISGDGRVDPVPFTVKRDLTGLGKVTQDVRMIETTVSQRRGLDSERMVKETDEQRKLREEAVAQKAAVQSEISNVLKAFYCTLCDKQFQNVAQYDEHTNSYAHHHKARMSDLQANHPLKRGGKEESDRRKEKERKREAKELKKIAAAAGVKITAPVPSMSGEGVQQSGAETKGSKKSGWATVSSATHTAPSSSPAGSLQPSAPDGWGPATSESSAGASHFSKSGTGWQTTPPVAPPAYTSAPAFRTGGWTSLSSTAETALLTSESSYAYRERVGTRNDQETAPPPPASAPPPPPPDSPPPPPRGGWSSVGTAPVHPTPPSAVPVPTPPVHQRGGWSTVTSSIGIAPSSSLATPLPPPPSDPSLGRPQLPPADNFVPPEPSSGEHSRPQLPLSQDDRGNQRPASATNQRQGNWQQWQRNRGQGGKR